MFAAIAFGCASLCVAEDATPNTVSRPAGYVRIHLPSNEHTLVAFPFDVLDNSINAILSGQLTGGDQLLKWDPAKPGYNMAIKIDGTGNPKIDGKWFTDPTGEATDMTLVPGEGFFIVNRQPNDQVVFLKGNLALSPTNTQALLPTLNLIGSPFSTSINITNTAIWEAWAKEGQGANGAPSDEIVDPTLQINATMEIALGQGYWYNRRQEDALLWTEVRPYADLFPKNDNPPLIKAIDVVNDGAAVKLTIDTTGQAGELLDIFYKDVASTGAVTTASGWKIAEMGMSVNGATTVTWVDAGTHERAKVNEGYGRYYLVGRGDLDLNGDGVPDARSRFAGVKGRIKSVRTTDSRPADTNQAATTSGQGGRTVYVDAKMGDDGLSGRARLRAGNAGPKRTIRSAMLTAKDGDTVVILPGIYVESANLGAKDVDVRFEGDVRIK
jgi:hypothetical protein